MTARRCKHCGRAEAKNHPIDNKCNRLVPVRSPDTLYVMVRCALCHREINGGYSTRAGFVYHNECLNEHDRNKQYFRATHSVGWNV